VVTFLQFAISGIAVGAVYGLVALGFVVIFKSTDVFNFAQGDFLMVGGYALFAALSTFKLPLAWAIVATIAFAAGFGVALQLLIFRHLFGKPILNIVMVTIALSLIIRVVLLMIFGPQEKSLPERLPDKAFRLGELRMSSLDLTVIAAALVCVALFALFFRKSRLGLQMRATAESPEAAVLCGIDSDKVFMAAFGIGTATAGIGGILMGNLQVVSPTLSAIGILAIPAAVVGGLTSIPGAVVGGLVIGLIQQIVTGYYDPNVASAAVYGVLLVLLLVRPYGLFGKPVAQRV
jgi:branched-chain amino acid transport system permease protein